MKSVNDFAKMKKNHEKIVMITAYDYPSGLQAQKAGVDLILTGDSLGMVVLGYQNTLQVTVEDIIHHTAATRRGAPDTFIIADMPHMSYHISPSHTRQNAGRIMRQTQANALKLEGGKPSRIQAVKDIVDCEIPVCGHLGLTPQSINAFGGYKVQGKQEKQYKEILQQAMELEDAGAFMLVLECIPEQLGKEITQKLCIPTIGIGAGRWLDGQVLVYHDLLGMSDIKPRFVKHYNTLQSSITNSIASWKNDVKNSLFPARENVYSPLNENGD